MIFEVCVDSVSGAIAAQAAGSQRVELCDNLVEGGTTPSLGLIQTTRQKVTIDINVLIRPRGGDFCYSGLEMEVMRQDIFLARQAGVNGVVLGVLKTDGRVDLEKTRSLVEIARPLTATFHRAFDLTRDPLEALEDICSLGIERILTSGQQPSALAGLGCLSNLVRQAAGRTIILAGGGINSENVEELLLKTGVQEIHFSARKTVTSDMDYQKAGVYMGKAYQPDEFNRKETDMELIRKVLKAAGAG